MKSFARFSRVTGEGGAWAAILRAVRRTFVGVVWTVVVMYIVAVILLHLSPVQRSLARGVSGALGERLGTEVEIGRIDLGLLNRLVVDDVLVPDLQGRELLRASRIAMKVDYLPTLRHLLGGGEPISVSSLQLFGVKSVICPGDSVTPANYQFIIDAFASSDTTRTPLNMRVGAVVVRRGSVIILSGDHNPAPQQASESSVDELRGASIQADNISANIALPCLTDDSIAVTVKKIAAQITVQHAALSTIDLRQLSFALCAGKEGARVSDLVLRLPNTTVRGDEAIEITGVVGAYPCTRPHTANATTCEGACPTGGQPQRYAPTLPSGRSITYGAALSGHIEPKDFISEEFIAKSEGYVVPLDFRLAARGSEREISISDLWVHSDAMGVELQLRGTATDLLTAMMRWKVEAVLDIQRAGDHTPASRRVLSGELPQGSTPTLPSGRGVMQAYQAIDAHIELSALGRGSDGDARLAVSGAAGNVDISASVRGTRFSGNLKTEGIDIGALTGYERLSTITGELNIDGLKGAGRTPWQGWDDISRLSIDYDMPRVDYNGYTFRNITGIVGATLAVARQEGDAGTYPYGRLHTADATTRGGACSTSGRPQGYAPTSGRPQGYAPTVIAHLWSVDDAPGDGLPFSISDFQLSTEIDDPNGYALLTAEGESLASWTAELTMRRFAPQAMKLLKATGEHKSTDGRAQGYAPTTGDSCYVINQAHARAKMEDGKLTTAIESDIVSGKLYADISGGQPQGYAPTFDLQLHRGTWLRQLFGIDIALAEPVTAVMGGGTLMVDAPHLTWGTTDYEDVAARLSIVTDTLTGDLCARRVEGDGRHMDITMHTMYVGAYPYGRPTHNIAERLYAEIGWDNGLRGTGKYMSGTLRAEADMPVGEYPSARRLPWEAIGASRGRTTVSVMPSEIVLGDSVWRVQPATICYDGEMLSIDSFAIRHDDQHLLVSGRAMVNSEDSITADLKDIDIDYILNLVNFRSVRFGGHASGHIAARGLFGARPEAAGRISVDDFSFQAGDMGRLDAFVRWNTAERCIDIDAGTFDHPDKRTTIRGYVRPSPGYIDLDILPRGASVAFLESFCGFMHDVDVQAWGDLRLYGELKDINLTGQAVARGSIGIRPTGTTYHLRGDTITLVPDEIIFSHDTVYDRRGNIAVVNGALHHRHLTRLTYDIDIDARNVLAYDTHDYGGNTFFGTVYATGDCSIRGRRGSIDIDVNATPTQGSFIEYNAGSTGSEAEQEYITFRSRDVPSWLPVAETGPAEKQHDSRNPQSPTQSTPLTSDMRINMLINATPDFTLRVLMDEGSGDYLALQGTGAIKATYYNKGGFTMFGNYDVGDGEYRLTIQNIMTRRFRFQDGSTVVFGGDPYDASLNLKALYTVNSVPLADLHIGNSFTGNNVRVDCMMNIGGTPYAPTVDFDMNLPTVSSDANQMVRSVINSEEEMNQQVIYLLTIGRFYVQDADDYGDETKPGQTSLAMQSVLSGTVSQQINKLLSSFVNISNWDVGANISTGDEGWNNAEYEGLISGRLMNNRLLINGQFGYRDNANATTSFIGDFDVQYLLTPNGNYALKVYNQTNDRYFTKSSLNTQGIGFVIKKDFGTWKEIFKK